MILKSEDSSNSESIRNEISDDVTKSIFIDAGAGAGKTTSIVGRVLSQIKAGVDPKRIVIITFTNKATEELQGRINKRILDASKDKDLSAKDRKIFEDAFKLLPSMNISTIHSFCFTILSEKSLDIKLPIGIELIEEDELKSSQDELFSKWIKTLKKDDFKKLTKDDRFQYKKINDLYLEFLKCEDSTYEFVKVDEKRLFGLNDKFYDLKNIINSKASEITDFINNIESEKSKPKYVEIENIKNSNCKKLLSYIDELSNINNFDDLVKDGNSELFDLLKETFKELKDTKLTAARKQKEEIKLEVESANSEIDDLKEKLLELKQLFDGYKYIVDNKTYIEYAYKAYEYFKDNRSKLKVSNNQLLYLTNEVINNPISRRYFAEKYDCIYVDEFQDTDYIQADFIWKLKEEIDLVHKEQNKEIGSLVVVGDPKQSIYRFKGANPEVFFEIKDKYSNLDSIIYSLNYNFRSNNLILDYVNDEFSTKDIQGLDDDGGNRYNKMLYNADHIVPNPNSDKCISGVFKLDENGLSEEEHIALLIRKLIDEKYLIPRYNKEKEMYEWEQIKYSDFMVLFRNFSNTSRYIDTFKKYSIPVSINGKIDFSSEHGIKAFIRIFKSLVSPKDKTLKMGAIEALRMNDYPVKYDDEDKAFKYYNDLYSYIYNETKNLSAYSKALYLVNHLEFILGDNDSYQSIRVKLEQLVEQGLANNFSNGISLGEFFETYIDADHKVGEEIVMKENVNSIRFMNSHKSKGLEASIVIWVTSKEGLHSVGDFYRDKNKMIFGIKADKDLYEYAEKEDMRDDGRMEYVILTRAEQVFIYTNKLQDSGLFNREGYDYHLDNLAKYQVGKLPEIVKFEEKEKDCGNYSPKEKVINDDKEYVLIETSPSKYEVHETIASGEKLNNRPVGNVLGTIMHRALELMVLRRNDDEFIDYDEKTLSDSVNQAINESCDKIDYEKDYQKYYDFIKAVVYYSKEYFKNSKIMLNSAIVEPEMEFSIFDDEIKSKYKTEDDDTPIYLTGSMDLVIIYDDSALIIDYKSDAKGFKDTKQFSDHLKNQYKPQLDIYKRALSDMYNIDENKIKTKVLYFYDYNGKNIVKVGEVDL